MSVPVDHAGEKYGRLTVISRVPNRKEYWLCRCECGTEKEVHIGNLTSGRQVSCGCYGREAASKSSKTHGESKTRLYRVWGNMKSRCYNPKVFSYYRYGSRGIKVCDEWKCFESFRDWALANGYRDDLTIERKDLDGDYCPENCCWVTREEQANNKSTNRFIEFNGETLTVAQWAHRLGMDHRAMWDRLFVQGWSVQRALTTPPRGW